MMHFTQLWGLFALISVPIILLLYAFRPKRETLRVSSNRLWQEALRERQRGLGLQKLLRDVSLALALILAVLLSLGLAGLVWSTHSTERNDVVLVIDVSASMQAKSVNGSTRLEEAKRQAKDIIDGLDSESRLLLMSSGRHALMRSAFESDRPTLERALNQLDATDETGNPREALSLALSVLRSRQQGKVYFITDGAFDDLQDLDTARIDFRVIQGSDQNLAITRFDIRPEVGSLDRYQILVTVRNYTDESVVAALNIELNEQPLINQTLQLAAKEKRVLVLPIEGRMNGAARASIAFGDDFSQDNNAYAVVANEEPLQLLLVGSGNLYLESVFAALPNVVVHKLEKPDADFSSQIKLHDVVVLDRVSPEEIPEPLPPGFYLLIDTLPAGLPLSKGQYLDQPVIIGNATGSVLTANEIEIDLTGLEIDQARQIEHTTDSIGLQRLFWSHDTDLALAYVDEDVRAVLLNFTLSDSNFPLLASFPLFLAESLTWLNQRLHRYSRTQIEAGEVITLVAPDQKSPLLIETPDGKTLHADPVAGKHQIRETGAAGFYQYSFGETEGQFAVNLTSEHESNIQTRAVLPVHSPTDSTARIEGRVDIPLWPWLVFIALAMMVLEWSLWCWRGVSA